MTEKYVKKCKDMCQNNEAMPNNILKTKCESGEKEYEIIVKYNNEEEDVLYLCKKCKDRLLEDAEDKGFDTNATKLNF